ncbi:MAG: NAD(P)H-dependent oxidoreductase, partial [Nitrospirota bacterium]
HLASPYKGEEFKADSIPKRISRLADYPRKTQMRQMYKEYKPGRAPQLLQLVADLIIPADAYIIVSGENNHTIPPALSNVLDHFLEEYFSKTFRHRVLFSRGVRRSPCRNDPQRYVG